MTPVHSSPAEWLSVSIAPDEGELEICVMDYNGMVRALEYPCYKRGDEWADASNKKLFAVQPTHWRKWIERH
ncbi:MAG: hypothetical protein HY852_22315 [Bradyrhizobium sp.]|uniref:hypothetical protein n=1 Tax=Bradyrhizobium sp. TaxID=376 RepID=UPI0025C620C3|nr:hypothetical protein [Bradyrhizobium sp.]MBI5264540.1 hypothetical protein [Bradyrhizobium sp.]